MLTDLHTQNHSDSRNFVDSFRYHHDHRFSAWFAPTQNSPRHPNFNHLHQPSHPELNSLFNDQHPNFNLPVRPFYSQFNLSRRLSHPEFQPSASTIMLRIQPLSSTINTRMNYSHLDFPQHLSARTHTASTQSIPIIVCLKLRSSSAIRLHGPARHARDSMTSADIGRNTIPIIALSRRGHTILQQLELHGK